MTPIVPIAALVFPVLVTLVAAGDTDTKERLTAWRADLDYLYEEIEKPPSLREILKVKGIEWPRVKKETNKRFKALTSTATRRSDPRADEIAYYDLLRHLIGQLRDSHAHVDVDESIQTAWRESLPPWLQAGVEFLPGANGVVIVSNTFAARGADSPLYARGIRHEATVVDSIDGTSAVEYFSRAAERKYVEEGWQSTLGRAQVEAMNDLTMAEGGELELVFKALDVPESARRKYVELDPKKRKRAFRKLTWETKKVTLRASECAQARNPRNFVFMHLELPELQETSDPRVQHGVLESGFGYIRYTAVSGKSRAGLEEALASMEDRPGVVLDMRLNGGGGESGIDVFDRKNGHWDKPVAVLMGPKSMSAAETEIWSLRELVKEKRCDARLFGQTTAGSSGDKIRFALPSGFAKGQFVFRHWHGGRSQIEGTGIEPEEVVDQDVVELSLGINSCIRAAEEWLRVKNRDR